MSAASPALLLEPQWLAEHLHDQQLRIVDLCGTQQYAQRHLPGALHLAYADIVRQQPPAGGLLPEAAQFAARLSALGIGNRHHVVAYDDEGGGRAARLIWTLHAYGHERASLLDGGLIAWANAGLPLTDAPATYPPERFEPDYRPQAVADYDYIRARLGDPDTALLDARSPGEYSGTVQRAAHAGHLPGARHLEWTELMDRARDLRLKAPQALRALLAERGVTPEQEVIVYCHTHHRSALNYVALKSLGWAKVRGYPGSWSDWGNRPEAPVER